MAAENANVGPGDVVAVWGCGPVGQFAIRSAFMLGASRVIAIDRFGYRLDLARQAGAETIDRDRVEILEALYQVTGGRGPDVCIDCVGMEAHGAMPDAVLDKMKQEARLQFDRAHALREAVQACGKGGRLSVPGVYTGFIDGIPIGAIFAKGLSLHTGQTHAQRYMAPLMGRIARGELDASFVITHRGSLDDAPAFYAKMARHDDGFVKGVMQPGITPVTGAQGSSQYTQEP